MTAPVDQHFPQLIEPPRQRRRQIAAFIVILIVVIGLVISFLIQPFGSPDNQQGNVFGGLGWIAQIIVSFILLLASIVQLTGYSIRDLFSSRPSKTNVEEFPFYVFQEYDKLIDYLFPDPKTPLISDRKIKYLPQISSETDIALQEKGMILIRGRSKTGKTREACELLRRWWYSGPTVLVARSHVGLYPPFKIPENLPVRNLVLVFDDIDRYFSDSAALKRLDETLQFFQNSCHGRGELRVIATVRQEEEFWGKLNFDKTQLPWNKFELIQLDPLSSEKAQKVVAELSKMSEIVIEPELTKNLAEKNDGTFLNLALAFRGWLSQNIKTLTPEDIRMFEGALKTTWRRRYEYLAASHSDIKPVYAAIGFMQSYNLPLRPQLINELATEMRMRKGILSLLGLSDRLQNWVEMSPVFNWHREPKQRRKGWLSISIAGVLIAYLLLYAFLRFTPGNAQFWFFDGLSKKVSFQILCLLPLWILLIPFAFYSMMNTLRNLTFRRMNKALDLLLATEVPMRGSELRPYENQFEGNGSTENWDLTIYSGEIHEHWFTTNVSQRLSNRYIFLAEQFRLNGEFSPARKLAALAQKILPDHPASIFMLGKIDIDEGNFQNALEFLKVSQSLYRRSNNLVYVQERRALIHLLLGEYENAEQIAEEALHEMSSLLTARWVLGLAQLRQGKMSVGYQNCRIATLSNQAIPREIQKVLEKLEANWEDWFNNVNVTFSTSTGPIPRKWGSFPTKALGSFFLVVLISVSFLILVPYLGSRIDQAESGLTLTNAGLTIFPGSPLLIGQRGSVYIQLGEYERALQDINEAIRIDPEFVAAYTNRGYAYLQLGESKQAIQDLNEAIRIDPEVGAAYTNRGYAYLQLGESKQAIQDLNEAIRIDPEVAAAYSDRGWAYLQLGEYEQAIQDLNEALHLDPEFVAAYNNRGFAYLQLGEYEQAIQDLNEAIRIDPEDGAAYHNRGDVYLQLGESKQAIVDYSMAIHIDPENAVINSKRGDAYSRLGEYEKAIVDYSEAIRIDSEYAYAYYGRGDVYLQLGESKQAIVDYSMAIHIDPENAVINSKRGDAYSRLGEYEKAIVDYSEAIRIDSEYAYAYHGRGIAYKALGEYQKAIADYTEAIQIDPVFAHVYYISRGDAYVELGEFEKAIVDYTATIRIEPENISALLNRSRIYGELGENEKAVADYIAVFHLDSGLVDQCNDPSCWRAAIQYWNSSIQLNSSDTIAYRGRGIAYYYLGEYEKSIVDFTDAIRIDPKFHNVYNWRGVTYNEIGEYEKAISDFTEALLLYPMYSNAYYERGYAYASLGEYEKAIADYSDAIRIDLKYADAYYGRGLAYKAIGKEAEATEDFKTYEELNRHP